MENDKYAVWPLQKLGLGWTSHCKMEIFWQFCVNIHFKIWVTGKVQTSYVKVTPTLLAAVLSVLTAGVSTASSLLAFWKEPIFSLVISDSLGASLLRQAFHDAHSGPPPHLAQAPMASAELTASSELISLSLSPDLESYNMYHNPQLISNLRKGKWKDYHPTLFFPSCWSDINLNCQPICIVKS